MASLLEHIAYIVNIFLSEKKNNLLTEKQNALNFVLIFFNFIECLPR